MAKKALSFFELCAYGLGVIGGIGYACYCRAWVIAIAVAVLGAMAVPEAREAYKRLTA